MKMCFGALFAVILTLKESFHVLCRHLSKLFKYLVNYLSS